MPNLEDAIRAMVKRGELTYLSLVPRVEKGKLVWSARYRGASEGFHGMAQNADPVAALLEVISSKPSRKKPKATADEDEDFG